jgi:hypothetical protein
VPWSPEWSGDGAAPPYVAASRAPRAAPPWYFMRMATVCRPAADSASGGESRCGSLTKAPPRTVPSSSPPRAATSSCISLDAALPQP